MTTLPAKAGSFSGHARANAPRSALKAPSGPANVWPLCALLAASIYSSKGRSGAAGLLAGLILGPAGVLLALFSTTSEEGLVRQGKKKRCPHCAELIQARANVCRYCGSDVADAPIKAKRA